MQRPLALVVDSDPAVRQAIRHALEQRGAATLGAPSAAGAGELLANQAISLLWLSADAESEEVPRLLQHVLRLQPTPLVIGLAAWGQTQQAARLIEAGAFDILEKPIEAARLGLLVERILRQHELLAQLRRLRQELQAREGYAGLVGRSAALTGVREQLARLAATESSVWFTGEPGTGKELAARTLHGMSRRRERPFALLDCAAWGLREQGEAQFRELWAHAAGGTLYLEQLPVLGHVRQERLLHLLRQRDRAENGVRLLASSLGEPRSLVEQGRLLPELPSLLEADTLRLIPLRERSEDIPLLARHFLASICEINHLVPLQLTSETLALLERHTWPGNVQELRNAMEHAAILAAEGRVHPRDLPEAVRELSRVEGDVRRPGDLAALRFRQAKRRVVDHFEKAYLRQLLQRHGGNVTSASQQAGMLRSALQRLLRKHGLRSADFREGSGIAAEDFHP